MKEYTYIEARQQLATVLDEVVQYGEVRIVRRNGTTFTIRLDEREESPLDIEPIEVNDIRLDDIMSAIRESRER
jgi:PHD/YefM family antitoxin component YafN of YafNO toxin-antitoxin module